MYDAKCTFIKWSTFVEISHLAGLKPGWLQVPGCEVTLNRRASDLYRFTAAAVCRPSRNWPVGQTEMRACLPLCHQLLLQLAHGRPAHAPPGACWCDAFSKTKWCKISRKNKSSLRHDALLRMIGTLPQNHRAPVLCEQYVLSKLRKRGRSPKPHISNNRTSHSC